MVEQDIDEPEGSATPNSGDEKEDAKDGKRPSDGTPVADGGRASTVVRRMNWRMVLQEHRRYQFLRAVLVGLGAGAAAVLFQYALEAAESQRAVLAQHFRALGWLGYLAMPVLCAVGAGVAGWLTRHFAPEASGSGIPHIKGTLMHVRALDWRRLLPVKFVGGVLAIGSGLSLGREGPTVQMGAAVGKAVAEYMHLPRRSRGQLIAAGAGAGLAAAFNAPLAGFIFSLEELQREFSALTYGTALIAAVIADIVTRSVAGQQSSFHVRGYPMPHLAALPLFALVGLFAGVVGVFFNRSLLWCLRRFNTQKIVPRGSIPFLVGGLAGVLIWLIPEGVGGGHVTAERVLSGHYAAPHFFWYLLVLLVVKFGLTVASYASGVPGGIFAPLLVLGAIVGLMTGQVGSLVYPALTQNLADQNLAAFAVVGMAAAFAAIVRAPLTGIVLILEMTNNYEQLFPLLVACMIAFLVAERMRNKPIYEALLEYDLQRSGYVQHPDAGEPVTMTLAVEPHSRMDGRRVGDLSLPENCLMVLITRGSREIFPAENTRLLAGDQLTFFIKGDSPQSCAVLQSSARAGTPTGKS